MKDKHRTLAIAMALVIILASATVVYNMLAAGKGETSGAGGEKAQMLIGKEGREPAGDFKMETADGKTVSLSDYFGKPVVINFWATWCSYCRKEMPHFENAYKEKGKDIHFIMLDAVGTNDETKEEAAAYIKDEGYTFPVYYDAFGEGLEVYQIDSFPQTIVIDKDGNVASHQIGAMEGAPLNQILEEILQE